MDQLRFDLVDIKENFVVYGEDFDLSYDFILDAFINGRSLRDYLKEEVEDIDSFEILFGDEIDKLSRPAERLTVYEKDDEQISLNILFSKKRVKWLIYKGESYLFEFHFDFENYINEVKNWVGILDRLSFLPFKLRNKINEINEYPVSFASERDVAHRYRLERFDLIKEIDRSALKETVSISIFNRFYSAPDMPLERWWWHLDKINKAEYPEEYFPEYLRDYYRAFKDFFKEKKELPYYIQDIYRKQFTGKEQADRCICFLFGKDKKVCFNEKGNIAFGGCNDPVFEPFPFDKEIMYYADPSAGIGFGLERVIRLKNFFKFMEKEAYLRAYREIEDIFSSDSITALAVDHFDFQKALNFLIEAELGSFDFVNLIVYKNEIYEHYFQSYSTFSTRVVGVKYSDEQVINDLKEGQTVYVIWEDINRHDKNALKVINSRGEKIGYIRKTLSPYILSFLKRSFFIKGEIRSILDSDIFVRLSFDKIQNASGGS